MGWGVYEGNVFMLVSSFRVYDGCCGLMQWISGFARFQACVGVLTRMRVLGCVGVSGFVFVIFRVCVISAF